MLTRVKAVVTKDVSLDATNRLGITDAIWAGLPCIVEDGHPLIEYMQSIVRGVGRITINWWGVGLVRMRFVPNVRGVESQREGCGRVSAVLAAVIRAEELTLAGVIV